jgi:spermidine/putrescine transport system substrate-binding protein
LRNIFIRIMKTYILIFFAGLLTFAGLAKAEPKILNVYTWGNYLPDTVIHQFTKETGIKINLAEYDNNETMYAKLKAVKDSGYDIVVPSSYYVERMAKQNMLHPIDQRQLKNFTNLNPALLNKEFDPGNKYSIPYLWGSTGIIINTQYIDPKSIHSWSDFWLPQYRDQLMILDDMRDVYGFTFLTLGYPINDSNPEHIKQAYLKLRELLPNVKIFNIDTVPNIYVDEDATIGMAWSGDCNLAREENPHLQYIYPREGFSIWIDNLAIVKTAPHLENAYKFIDFVLRPEIAKQISLAIGHSTANLAAMKLMPARLQNNQIFNPDTAILKRGSIQRDIDPKTIQIYEKFWEKLKIGD